MRGGNRWALSTTHPAIVFEGKVTRVQRERKVGGEAKQAVCEEGGADLSLVWMMGIMGR